MANTKIVNLNTPGPAQYGQTTDYGKFGKGVAGASAEAENQGHFNDSAQGAVAGATGYAQDAAANGTGFTGGEQNAGDANQQASGANGNQAGAIELARRMAAGNSPSAGAIQLQRGLNQGSAQQTAMAAGARGSAGIATAQGNAAANTSNMQQNAFTGAGMLRSQDMATGRGLYASLTNDQRGQDQAATAEANRVGMANAKASDDYRLGMGNAAVGFGAVANGQNQNDLSNFQRGMAPVYGQDEMNQQGKEWLYEDRQHAATDNAGNT